jgi:hypothetical protein
LLIEIGGAKSAVMANSSAVPPAAVGPDQRLEIANILATRGAAEAPRFTKSAVFAAVTSESGRRSGRFI